MYIPVYIFIWCIYDSVRLLPRALHMWPSDGEKFIGPHLVPGPLIPWPHPFPGPHPISAFSLSRFLAWFVAVLCFAVLWCPVFCCALLSTCSRCCASHCCALLDLLAVLCFVCRACLPCCACLVACLVEYGFVRRHLNLAISAVVSWKHVFGKKYSSADILGLNNGCHDPGSRKNRNILYVCLCMYIYCIYGSVRLIVSELRLKTRSVTYRAKFQSYGLPEAIKAKFQGFGVIVGFLWPGCPICETSCLPKYCCGILLA